MDWCPIHNTGSATNQCATPRDPRRIKWFKNKQGRSRGRGRQITSLTYNLSPLPNYNGRTMAIIIDHRYQTREYTRVFRDHKGDLLSPKRGSTIATQLYPSRGKSSGLESKECVIWTIPEVTPQIWSKSTTRSKHSLQKWKVEYRPSRMEDEMQTCLRL